MLLRVEYDTNEQIQHSTAHSLLAAIGLVAKQLLLLRAIKVGIYMTLIAT